MSEPNTTESLAEKIAEEHKQNFEFAETDDGKKYRCGLCYSDWFDWGDGCEVILTIEALKARIEELELESDERASYIQNLEAAIETDMKAIAKELELARAVVEAARGHYGYGMSQLEAALDNYDEQREKE